MNLMARRDGRSLDHPTLEEMRRLAVKRALAGEPQVQIAKSLEMHPRSVWRWVRDYRAEGEKGLESTTATGRPPALTEKQLARLRKAIIGKRPEQLTLGGALWTIPLVGELITKLFGTVLHQTTIGRTLHRLGLSPQKPVRRAFQRDEEACLQWMKRDFPVIVRASRKRQSTLLFVDETAVQENGPVGTTWGVKGETPVVGVSASRYRINVISAISPRGQLWFRCYDGTLDAETFLGFLKDLRSTFRKPLDIIFDRHPSHVAASVARWIHEHRDRLRVHFLPPYAPDLNPDEHVWSALKGAFRRDPIRHSEVLLEKLETRMYQIKDDRALVRSFFDHPEVAYVKEALGW